MKDNEANNESADKKANNESADKKAYIVEVADRYDKEWSATFRVKASNAIKAIDFVKTTINPKYVFRKTYSAEQEPPMKHNDLA